MILPIFPLSNVVLFPRVVCPLHLFEPRYRQLGAHALGGDRRIGMVVVPPEHADAMEGDPPVYPVGCAGEIASAERLPDGRYNIVLLGTQRFRIAREQSPSGDRLYRVAEVVPLADPYAESERERVATLRARVMELLSRLLQRSAGAEAFSPQALDGVDDVACVNALCNGLTLPPSEKQGLLEADGISERFDRLEGLLSFHLAQLSAPGGPGSGLVH
jgi:Lon protease-like protein